MSQLLPPGLGAMLSQAPPDQRDPAGQADPLEDLQGAIDAMHSLMVTLKDPDAVHQVGKALVILTGLQRQMMTSESGGPAQAPPQ